MAFRDLDLVKYSNYIKLSKVFSTIKYVKYLINWWQWVPIFNSNCIQALVVMVDTYTAAKFYSKKE